jgi:hypothetical protein
MKAGTTLVLLFLIPERLEDGGPLLHLPDLRKTPNLLSNLMIPEKIENISYHIGKEGNSFLRSALSTKELLCLLRITDLLKIWKRSST